MKKVLAIFGSLLLLNACDSSEVGDVSLGLFTTKDIKLNILQDPLISGVLKRISVSQIHPIALSPVAKRVKSPLI